MQRYQRSLRLRGFERDLEFWARHPDYFDPQGAEYRHHCLANWHTYLEGLIPPQRGRKGRKRSQ
jgi:hypothetical protein